MPMYVLIRNHTYIRVDVLRRNVQGDRGVFKWNVLDTVLVKYGVDLIKYNVEQYK